MESVPPSRDDLCSFIRRSGFCTVGPLFDKVDIVAAEHKPENINRDRILDRKHVKDPDQKNLFRSLRLRHPVRSVS